MSRDIDRRTFLTSAPRHLLSGVKALMNDVAVFAWPIADKQEHAALRRVALLDVSRCLAWTAVDCQLCYLKCPKRDEAIVLEEDRPVVVASACDGCGVCVDVCRSINDLGAIQLVDTRSPQHLNEDR